MPKWGPKTGPLGSCSTGPYIVPSFAQACGFSIATLAPALAVLFQEHMIKTDTSSEFTQTHDRVSSWGDSALLAKKSQEENETGLSGMPIEFAFQPCGAPKAARLALLQWHTPVSGLGPELCHDRSHVCLGFPRPWYRECVTALGTGSSLCCGIGTGRWQWYESTPVADIAVNRHQSGISSLES